MFGEPGESARLGRVLDGHGIAAVVVEAGRVIAANRTAVGLIEGSLAGGDPLAAVDEAFQPMLPVPQAEGSVLLSFAADHMLIETEAQVVPVTGGGVLVSFDPGPRQEGGAHTERLEAMLESTTDLITVIDTSGRIRYSNAASGRLTGMSGREANGRWVLDFIHPDDVDRVADVFARLQADDPPNHPVELRLRFADGEWHHVEADVQPAIEIDGVACHVVTLRDVTDRVRQKAEIDAAHRRLEAIVEDLDEVVVLLGEDLSVLWTSPGIERLVDAPAYTNVGENAFNDMHPDDIPGVGEALTRAMEDPTARPTAAFRLEHRRLGWRWVEATITNRLADPAVEGLVCTLRDVTDERDQDAEMARLRAVDREELARLREADRSKDSFLATLTHELRTPITSVRGFAEILLLDARLDEAARRQLLERILANAGEMEELVEQLLDYSRLRGGRLQLDIVELDLDREIAGIVDRLEHHLRRHDVRVEETGIRVRGDRRALGHVLRNLLTNAARYSSPGTQIRIHGDLDAAMARVHVTDQGIGIAEEEQTNVFRSFYQLAPPADGRGGIGVGLNIARHYAQHQDGRLSLESVPGEGSTFTLHLPVVAPAEGSPADGSDRVDARRS